MIKENYVVDVNKAILAVSGFGCGLGFLTSAASSINNRAQVKHTRNSIRYNIFYC